MPTRPDEPEMDAEAHSILESAGAIGLRRAIGALEGATWLDRAVLVGLGSGLASGERLVDCVTAAEKAKTRNAIVGQLVLKDPVLIKKFGAGDNTTPEKQRVAMLAVGRAVTAVVELADGKVTKPLGGDGGEGGATTVMFAATEEERAYTDQSFDTKRREEKRALMSKMYGRTTRDHMLAASKAFKQIAYWIEKEGCFPDPERVGLEAVRKKKVDSPYTLFARLMVSCGIVACGKTAAPTLRDDQAGVIDGASAQWFSMVVATELMDEVFELMDELTDAQLQRVIGLMLLSIHKATQRGSETASLAMAKLVAQIPSMAEAARGPTPSEAGSSKEKKEKKKKTAKPAEKAAKEKTPSGPKTGTKRKRPEGGWPDVEGKEGPNGLPRMKGGNPDGGPCKEHQAGKCQYKTCSFCH